MEQNKDIFPDKNNFPDNPYNQYYQEYLKDPEKEKNKISKPKQIGSMVLCGVRSFPCFSFLVLCLSRRSLQNVSIVKAYGLLSALYVYA